MSEKPPVELDEKYLADWIKVGMDEIAECLEKHAAFDAYYRNLNEQVDPATD